MQPVHKTNNLTALCEPSVLDNVGSLTSHNPIGLHSLLGDSFTFTFYSYGVSYEELSLHGYNELRGVISQMI
jgi:hypothetical protein